MSLRTAIESLPGHVVRGVFQTSNAMDINKTVGAILAAGLLAMATGVIANVLVPTNQEVKAAMAEPSSAAQSEGTAEAAGASTAEQVSQSEGEQQVPVVASQEAETVNEGAAEQTLEQTAQTGQPAGGGGDLAALIGAADPEQGKQIARKCLACHSFEPGGPNKVGPNLAGVVGADIASKDYAYSDALKSKEGTWTYQNLDAFLAAPKGWAPGTKMAFPGLKKPEERAAVIAYLRSLTDNPPPLQ